jgi:hypothetical protein
MLVNSDTRVTVTVAVVNAAHIVAIEQASNAAVSVVLWVVLFSSGLSVVSIDLEVVLGVILVDVAILLVGVGVYVVVVVVAIVRGAVAGVAGAGAVAVVAVTAAAIILFTTVGA